VRFFSQRRELLAIAQQLNPLGLNQGTSGNVSMRVEGGLLITPTGTSYDTMRPEDLVEMRLDGSVPLHQLLPSSEWRIHRDLYATRIDVGAVVHAHSMFATTLSCLRRGIPAVHYMIALAGGSDIRCADYATFGTAELSEHALRALVGRKACLLANHGMIALGTSPSVALKLAVEVETLAAQYWRALQIGEPVILDEEEMARVLERFRTYGQQRARPVKLGVVREPS
jgi:L-fuculose-phosphate aldolase